MRVLKYEVPRPDVEGLSVVDMPSSAIPLSVGVQRLAKYTSDVYNKAIVVWALVPDEAAAPGRALRVLNTGAPWSSQYAVRADRSDFLGTVDVDGNVWHVWDDGPST